MTSTAAEFTMLLADCDAVGIRCFPASNGKLTIDAPIGALTPDLLSRLKAHKADLLALFAPNPHIETTDAKTVWGVALDGLEGDPLFPQDVIEALRSADVAWATDELTKEPPTELASEPLGPDGWPANWVGADELSPCPKCGSLDQWESLAGDLFGRTPGKWRCMKCDPPTVAKRLAERAARIRRQ